MKRAAALLAVAALSLGLSACMEDDPLSITKTSKNTWTIYDPNNGPDQYLDKTCATEGREVRSVTTPGEAYEWLYVVCAPKPEPTTTPSPTTDSDSFSP